MIPRGNIKSPAVFLIENLAPTMLAPGIVEIISRCLKIYDSCEFPFRLIKLCIGDLSTGSPS